MIESPALAGVHRRSRAATATAAALLSLGIATTAAGDGTDTALGAAATAAVGRDVTRMLEDIPAELTRTGPIGWLKYFENDPRFLMAADGALQLDGYESAQRFLREFALGMPGVELYWGNVRVDPFSATAASVAAEYRERLTDRNGRSVQPHGYFTGLAVRTAAGWKLRAAHWSSPGAVP